MSEATHIVTTLGRREKMGILFHGMLVFALTGFLALFAVTRLGSDRSYVPSASVSVPYFLTIFFLMTLLLLAGLRATKGGVVFDIIFTIAILSGAWFTADVFFSGAVPLVLGSLVILARFLWKSTLSQNLALVFGISGIALAIGTDLSPKAILIILTVLVFYDIVAVYKTRHMVRMFRGLVARGVLFAFALTPLRWRDLRAVPLKDGDVSAGMLLGTGDVLLPVMLAVSVFAERQAYGIAVVLGAMAGFGLTYLIFLKQKHKRPLPALPPIALASVFFYLLSSFIF